MEFEYNLYAIHSGNGDKVTGFAINKIMETPRFFPTQSYTRECGLSLMVAQYTRTGYVLTEKRDAIRITDVIRPEDVH